MSTVGYGDISPTTYAEKIITIFLTIISCGVFAFAMNTIGTIFRDKQLKEASLKKQKFDVSMYMKNRNINMNQQMKVLKQLEYLEQQQEQSNAEGLLVLQQLPEKLSEDIFQDYYGRILKESRFYKEAQYSEALVQNLVPYMQEITIGPGYIIQKQGTESDRCYFLMDGILQVTAESRNKSKDNKIIQDIQGRQELGFIGFYTQNQANYTIQALSVSRLVFIQNEQLIKVLRSLPVDFEKYCFQKDNIMYNKTRLPEKCRLCSSFIHKTSNCSNIHLVLNSYQIIGRHTRVIKQESRKQYFRRNQNKSQQTLKRKINFDKIRIDLIKVRVNEVQKFYNEQIEVNFDEQDFEFFSNIPKLIQLKSGALELGRESDSEDEYFLKEEEEQQFFQEEKEYNKNRTKTYESLKTQSKFIADQYKKKNLKNFNTQTSSVSDSESLQSPIIKSNSKPRQSRNSLGTFLQKNNSQKKLQDYDKDSVNSKVQGEQNIVSSFNDESMIQNNTNTHNNKFGSNKQNQLNSINTNDEILILKYQFNQIQNDNKQILKKIKEVNSQMYVAMSQNQNTLSTQNSSVLQKQKSSFNYETFSTHQNDNILRGQKQKLTIVTPKNVHQKQNDNFAQFTKNPSTFFERNHQNQPTGVTISPHQPTYFQYSSNIDVMYQQQQGILLKKGNLEMFLDYDKKKTFRQYFMRGNYTPIIDKYNKFYDQYRLDILNKINAKQMQALENKSQMNKSQMNKSTLNKLSVRKI